MATYDFRGDAPAIAQVDTCQITAYDAATTYTLTINGKSVSVIAAGSVNDTASDLAAAWNAETNGEFAEVTAAANTDTITFTADTAGKPFTITSSKSGGTGTIGSVTNSTANSGPNALVAANFRNVSTGANALPTTGDTIHFRDSDVDLLYGLDALSGETLTRVRCWASYTGKIGLPNKNIDNSSATYDEYRERRLKVGITNLDIGEDDGSQSTRLWFDLENVQNTTIVHNTGNRESTEAPAVTLHGTHASNAYTVWKGDVGLAAFSGDATTISALTVHGGQVVAYDGAAAAGTIRVDDGSLTISSNITTLYLTKGAVNTSGSNTITTANVTGGKLNHLSDGTITTCNQDGGQVVSYGTITTHNCDSGNATIHGSATLGTCNLTGGTIDYRSSGNVTTLNVGGGESQAVFDSRNAPTDLAVATPTLHVNGVIRRAKGQTYTNDIAVDAGVREVTAA